MEKYILNPLDVIIFGLSNQFNNTEQRYRRSNIVINPIPIYGALKKHLRNDEVNLLPAISFISYVYENKLLFPVPFDVLKLKTAEVNPYIIGKLKQLRSNFLSDYSHEYVISFGPGKFERSDGKEYLTKDYFKEYLKNPEEFSFQNSDCSNKEGKTSTLKNLEATKPIIVPFNFEDRVGIEIDSMTGTTVEGHLFFQSYIRFKSPFKTGIYLETNASLASKVISLGGESKAVKVEEVSNSLLSDFFDEKLISEIKDKIIKDGFFKIVLLTITNQPREIDGAQLVAKIVNRPYVYSGWLNKNKYFFPSRVYKFISPGAVFYYKITTENKKKFVEELFNKYWLKPAFFKKYYPWFEETKDGTNPLCLGLSVIGSVSLHKD